MAYRGRLRPKGIPFSGFRFMMKGKGSLVAELYKRVGKSVILVGKRPKGLTDAFYGCEKVEKTLRLRNYNSSLKDS